MLIYEDGRTSGTIGGGELEARVVATAQDILADGKPRLLPYSLVDPGRGDPGVCGGEMELYLEGYLPPPTVLVIGCGHVGQAVAGLAHWLGFRVVVTDDRAELATPAQIPDADLYLPGDFADVLPQLTITRNTFVVVVTRNVLVDQQILPHLAHTAAPYVGVMGSKRRWLETRRLLLADGLPEEALARFHSPIGLELKAENPREIAVSIMAEIILRQRG
jgi:xanthine dehydrogenase accessory factor